MKGPVRSTSHANARGNCWWYTHAFELHHLFRQKTWPIFIVFGLCLINQCVTWEQRVTHKHKCYFDSFIDRSWEKIMPLPVFNYANFIRKHPSIWNRDGNLTGDVSHCKPNQTKTKSIHQRWESSTEYVQWTSHLLVERIEKTTGKKEREKIYTLIFN